MVNIPLDIEIISFKLHYRCMACVGRDDASLNIIPYSHNNFLAKYIAFCTARIRAFHEIANVSKCYFISFIYRLPD